MAIGQDRVIDALTSCRGNVSLAANKLALEAEHRALDEEMERYWADRQAHEMLK